MSARRREESTASTIADHLLVGSLHFQDAAGRFLSPVGRLCFSFRCFSETNHDQNDTNTAAMISNPFQNVNKSCEEVYKTLERPGAPADRMREKSFCEIRRDQDVDSKFERVIFVWCFGLTENIG